MKKWPVLAVVGPTASGKSAFSVELAKRISGEIISADSMQIYKGIPIGTAQPTKDETQGIPHHLIGVLPVCEEYSVARYVKDAAKSIESVFARGRRPIVTGGTGLYISSLLDHVQFDETAGDPIFRQTLEERAQKEGMDALLEELNRLDPETAQRLHPNNRKRVIRALEVYYTTGKTVSEQNRLSKSVPSPYQPLIFGLNYSSRERLYQRIEERVDQMMDQGLLEEARWFYTQAPCRTAKQAIGYKELLPFLETRAPLSECVDRLKQETRRYAKRQLTWFRRDSRIQWITVDGRTPDELVQEIMPKITAFYANAAERKETECVRFSGE